MTLKAFIQFFIYNRFELTDDPTLEPGWERTALYAKDEIPTHAVRQLPNGNWTSKMGEDEDIEITDPAHLEGADYGKVALYFRRKIRP